VRTEALLDAIRRGPRSGPAVRDWSVCFAGSSRLSLGIKDRQAGGAHTPLRLAQSGGARYLLVWEDGKVSRGYMERRQLEDEPLAALATARSAAYRDDDAAQVLGPAGFPEVELAHPGAAAVAAGDTVLIADRLASIRRRVDAHGFRTWSGSISAAEGSSRVVTSAGLDVEGSGTSLGWHVTLDGEIGSGFSARAPESAGEFEGRLDRLVETALRLRTDAEPMEGGSRPVLLHPRVVEDYVLETLLANLGGATVFHGEGRFRREEFGSDRPLLRDDLALRLDPLEPLKIGSYRFTGEGLPAAACTFIERGRLVSPTLDLKYARRLGLPPTPLPYGMDTLHLEGPEPLSLPAALDGIEEGALVLAVLGVHTQDRASGDFSLSAPQALRVSNGDWAGRIRATISGNLFELLADPALRLVRFEGEHTPGLLVHCRLDPK
jgi:PmbA protein